MLIIYPRFSDPVSIFYQTSPSVSHNAFALLVGALFFEDHLGLFPDKGGYQMGMMF